MRAPIGGVVGFKLEGEMSMYLSLVGIDFTTNTGNRTVPLIDRGHNFALFVCRDPIGKEDKLPSFVIVTTWTACVSNWTQLFIPVIE